MRADLPVHPDQVELLETQGQVVQAVRADLPVHPDQVELLETQEQAGQAVRAVRAVLQVQAVRADLPVHPDQVELLETQEQAGLQETQEIMPGILSTHSIHLPLWLTQVTGILD